MTDGTPIPQELVIDAQGRIAGVEMLPPSDPDAPFVIPHIARIASPDPAWLAANATNAVPVINTPVQVTSLPTMETHPGVAALNLRVLEGVKVATNEPLPSCTYHRDHFYDENGRRRDRHVLVAAAMERLVIHGVPVAPGDRILVNREANTAHNGIYVVSSIGTVVHFMLTRARDFNSSDNMTSGSCAVDLETLDTHVFSAVGPVTVGITPILWFKLDHEFGAVSIEDEVTA